MPMTVKEISLRRPPEPGPLHRRAGHPKIFQAGNYLPLVPLGLLWPGGPGGARRPPGTGLGGPPALKSLGLVTPLATRGLMEARGLRVGYLLSPQLVQGPATVWALCPDCGQGYCPTFHTSIVQGHQPVGAPVAAV